MEAEINIKSDNNNIRLKESKDILHLNIIDEKGKDTGEFLEFNLGDIDYLLILQDMAEEDKKNREYLKNQFAIIEKRQDHKGKKLFSANEEAKLKATRDFYKKEAEIYNMFLGKNGVEKLLNGKKLTLTALDEIDEIIETMILPKLQVKTEDIKAKIMKKYSNNKEKVEADVLE